jgi:hypothetical protein
VAVGGRLVWNDKEVEHLLHSKDGPTGRMLGHKAEIVTQGAKRRAPVSPSGSGGRRPGYLRSKIGWHLGKDEDGLFADIASPATTPKGAPYGLFMELGTKPHEIRWSRGSATGHLYIWDHPGTRPYPHLRPALEDLRESE